MLGTFEGRSVSLPLALAAALATICSCGGVTAPTSAGTWAGIGGGLAKTIATATHESAFKFIGVFLPNMATLQAVADGAMMQKFRMCFIPSCIF